LPEVTDPFELVPDKIVCVDCGGVCHLLTHRPADDPYEPGDTVAYRCEDCMDRWDLVVPDETDARGD
jgi:hypothetical protein